MNQNPENTTQDNGLQGGQNLAEQGRLYYRQGEFEEALSCFQRAYEQYQNDGTQGRVAETANDIGVVYTAMRRWGDAEKWISEAHKLFLDIKDRDGEAQTLGNLGSMFHLRGHLQEAAANLQLASDRFHILGDNERRMETLKVLSMVRLRQLRLLQSAAAYEAALACHPHPTAFHRFLRRLLALPLRVMRP
jgi:tetratricopeptide (TPR) repeat protein